MNISEIKSSLLAWEMKVVTDTSHIWHGVVESISSYLDEQQSVLDAVAMLQAKGYTVTPPQA